MSDEVTPSDLFLGFILTSESDPQGLNAEDQSAKHLKYEEEPSIRVNYDLADRMYQEADRRWNARKRFDAFSECSYLN